MSPALRNLLLLITAILALAAGYWLAQAMRPPTTPPVTTPTYGGGEMIDFSLPDLDDKKQSLGAWRGKVILLNFWATWCPPCREEIPLFVDLRKKHPADDLQIVGVAIDNKSAVIRYRQTAGINYPLLIGNDDTMDLMARYGNRMGSLPYSVIIDRGGSIAARKIGAFSRIELNGLIEPLLTPVQSQPSS
jgi:thiol-disulfide isomerase/thioredoxin